MHESQDSQSFKGKLKEIYRTANEEHSHATLGQRAILGTTLGGLAFEWSSGNESMIGLVAGRMHEITHSPLATALAAGGASFAEQSAIGTLMAMTIHSYPEVTTKIREVAASSDSNEGTLLKRYMSSMLLGSGVELAVENANRQHSKPNNVRRAVGNAAMIAVSNSFLVGGVSGLVRLGETHGFESTSEIAVDVASSPLTYISAIAGVLAYSKIKKSYAGRKEKKRQRDVAISANRSRASLIEASHNLLETDSGLTIAVAERIPTGLYDSLWEMVETGFQDLNQKSYEKQDMTQEELIADFESDKVLKYIARDDDMNPVGLLIVHKGLDGINWTSTDRLMKVQNEVDSHATPYYVGTIVVPVSERGTDVASSLIRGALLHFSQENAIRQEDSLVFFDCAEANYPWLGEFIQSIGNSEGQFSNDIATEVKELYVDAWVESHGAVEKFPQVTEEVGGSLLDRQHYYSIRIGGEFKEA